MAIQTYIKATLLSQFTDSLQKGSIENLLNKESDTEAVIDLSEPHRFRHFKLVYEAGNDNLYLEYKELNEIVNDLEITISLSSNDIDEHLFLALKNLALSKEVPRND